MSTFGMMKISDMSTVESYRFSSMLCDYVYMMILNLIYLCHSNSNLCVRLVVSYLFNLCSHLQEILNIVDYE